MNNIEKAINSLWFPDGHLSEMQKYFYIDLFQKNQPKTCLEIGFAGGRHTVTMMYSCSPSTIVSIDINFNYHNGNIFKEKIKDKFKNIIFIEGNSNKLLDKDFFNKYFPNNIDYVLIDGGHSYEEAITDMENCYPYLTENGIMVVDDYESSGPIGCNIQSVDNAVKDFAKKNSINYETIKLSDGKGMAIFKK